MSEKLLKHFDLLATAPGGVPRLRELILTLAVQGKLVPQDPSDEPASVLLQRIRAEKDRLIAEGKIRRDKPLPPIADEEKPFELPKGWEWIRLGPLASKLTDGSHNPPRDSGTGYPMLSSQNVWEGGVIDFASPTRHVGEEDFLIENSRTAAVPGDVLLTIVASLGRSAVVPLEAPAFVLQRSVAVIRTGLNPEFCSLFLRSPVSRAYYGLHGKGTAQKGIYLGKLGAMPIVVPPLAEQSRIVARVEELMRLCDALEAKGQLDATQHAQLLHTLLGTLTDSATPEELGANWQRVAAHFDLLLDRPEAVDALEQTILQLAVRGLLVPQDPTDETASALLQRIRAEKDRLIAEGKIKRDKPLPPITDEEKPFELPQGWEWVRLGTVADSRLGKMLDKAKNTGKPYPYIRNTNVQWRRFDLVDIKYINLEQNELDELRLRVGDLLICEGGEPGRCAIWVDASMEMYFQKALHRVRPYVGIASEMIAIALEGDARSGSLDKNFTGATIKHFVGQALDRYVFALPPLAEQSRIVARVEELRQLCADLRRCLTASSTTQGHLAEALVEDLTA